MLVIIRSPKDPSPGSMPICRANLGVSHADVAVQLGHTDGGALVMSTYGHPTEEGARERLKRAFGQNVAPIASGVRSQIGSSRS